MPLDRAEVIGAVTGAKRLALVHAPLSPTVMASANPELDAVAAAPRFTDTWQAMRAHLGGFIADQGLLGDQVLIIGDTSVERDWNSAARAAGYIEAQRYFA